MLHRKIITTVFIALTGVIAAQTATARAIRLDGGDWIQSVFMTGSTTEAIGFDMSVFGVTGNLATIGSDGSLSLGGGAETATFNPLFDPVPGAGNSSSFRFATTAATFAGNTPGVAAGFRAEWEVTDSAGALLNAFQLAMFQLTNGQFALEFNYDQVLFGSAASTQIGYQTSTGASFDLINALGLPFADLEGVGDDAFSNNCANTPSALACNNFYANTGAFGSGPSVLPDTAGGFFRQTDSNGAPVQGRYLFLSGQPMVIAEPASLGLLGIGLWLLALRRRHGL